MEKKNKIVTIDEIYDDYKSLWKKPFNPVKESELFHNEIVFLMEKLKKADNETIHIIDSPCEESPIQIPLDIDGKVDFNVEKIFCKPHDDKNVYAMLTYEGAIWERDFCLNDWMKFNDTFDKNIMIELTQLISFITEGKE